MLNFIKFKNRSVKKVFVLITLASFILGQTSSIAFGAALIPGFYGSTSSDITAPSVNALPSLKGIVQGVSSLEISSNNGLIIHQDESSAIIDWDSFNIGADAWVHFDQQGNSSWKSLNRIYDLSPSLIYGRLTADGQVYLINQNGIFFSSNSTVNVGSLVASSLNIADDDFLDGTLSFTRENYIDPDEELTGDGVVSNHGTITTADGGSVFLLGTRVENNGEISAYLGWAALAAGDKITLEESADSSSSTVTKTVTVEDGEDVYNYEDGVISADLGQAGMYGKTVTQNGIIRAVTAVTNGGRIELLASDKVTLGEGSVTSTPIDDSSEEYDSTFSLQRGNIVIGGLDTSDPVETIEDNGTILSPYGVISMDASSRIYLGEDSVIDVSGLWVTRSVSDKTVEVQLNSVELADDYGQKTGVLKGTTITLSELLGSSIGDVSDYIISTGDLTAEEMATKGGAINLNAGSGDIIFKEGALLDVSGGGINYTGGSIDTTKLVSVNGVVYDISDAPEWETYAGILGDFTKTYERYGVSETYTGTYYGGVASLKTTVGAFQEGSDAGKITLIASSMALDGTIDASVTTGLYQVYYPTSDEEELYDAMGISVPTAGTLIIGNESSINNYYLNTTSDPYVESVMIETDADKLSSDFSVSDAFPEEREGTTYISSSLIDNAGLSTLAIYSRTGITVEEDADISLAAGGSFTGYARSIIVEGGVYVPGGTIDLELFNNYTTGADSPVYVSQEELGYERIYLASGSVLSTAGEAIDNSAYESGTGDVYKTGLLDGGTILLKDKSLDGEGIVVADGATVDVSGGYEIDEDGKVSGGDAGALKIQGKTVILDGDLRGYSIAGNNGGSVSILAESVSVLSGDGFSVESDMGEDDDIPGELKGKLTIEDDFFDDTGFSDITLMAYDNIEVSSGSVIRPSYMKYYISSGSDAIDNYGTASGLQYGLDNGVSLINVSEEYLGDSSITLKAGVAFEGTVVFEYDTSGVVDIQSGADVRTGRGGVIDVEGKDISLEGTLSAPGGTITLAASSGDIILYSGSLISAKGYAIQDEDPLTDGLPMGYSVVDGGTVTMESETGDVTIESGATIDVSGSDVVTDYVWATDGSIATEQEASAPGTLNISFYDNLSADGEIKAKSGLSGLNGGSLNISKANQADPLEISGEDLSSYLSDGFDSITLASRYEIYFTDSMDIEAPRDLTLDAPIIAAASGSDISLASPWITLTNTYDYKNGSYAGEEGDSTLTLAGDYMDIIGYVTLSTFETATLISATDITLTDSYYNESQQDARYGGLSQTGDLVMQADRIYPTTLSSFAITSTGEITVLDNGDNLTGSSYSAGGSLTMEAEDIYVYGDIYAPLGSITLTSVGDDGIVYLGDGSTLSTHTDAYINYGLMDSDAIFWGLYEDNGTKLDTTSEVTAAPTGSVSVNADNVVMSDGASIDVSGGGTVFAYQYLASASGTENPLGRSGQYVILLDNSVYSPQTVTISGNSDIPAGTYYVLSEEYAFVAGAATLTDLGTGLNPSTTRTTEEGYSIVSGKETTETTAGTTLSSTSATHYYSVRDADDVLSEGDFEISELTSGDGGSVTIASNTTIIDGSIAGTAISSEYNGGTLTLSGTNVVITAGSSGEGLPDGFDPAGDLEAQIADLMNTLSISDSSISVTGMEKITLGDSETTSSLTIESGVTLEVQTIELDAKDEITIGENAVITAESEGGDGSIIFSSPEGVVYIASGALVSASDAIELDTSTFHILGTLEAEGGEIAIKTGKIYFISDGSEDITEAGGYITQSLWQSMSTADSIVIGSGSEIDFEDSFDLSGPSDITLDASLIESEDSNITVLSGSVTLQNSGDAYTSSVAAGSGELVIKGDQIYLISGTVTFDGFSGITLESSGDVTAEGTGGLKTGDADLNIKAASIKSGLLSQANDDDLIDYYAMDYTIDAGEGAMTIASNGADYTSPSIAGGSLEISAKKIIQTGVVDMPGAYITYNATGSGSDSGIFLKDGAVINAAGNDSATGGEVSLVSEGGIVSLASGSSIDVSAGGQGDAGKIEIVSPIYTAVLDGDLSGNGGDGGTGGSFSLDTASIGDLGDIITILSTGGFDDSIELRARTGDITLATGEEMTAGTVKISADGSDGGGDINIYGTIDASGATDGAIIELYTGGDLNLYSGSSLIGSATGSDIMLSGKDGLAFKEGAIIDAGGRGDVTFRSYRSDTDELDMTLEGAVIGTDTITAESVKVYEDDDSTVDSSDISSLMTDTASYMADALTLKKALFSDLTVDDGTELYFTPGIEIDSTGDLTIKNDWDLTSYRYDTDGDGTSETAGAFILRAAGAITINGSITDAPMENTALWEETALQGWDIYLSAGADLTAADPVKTSTDAEGGDLMIKSGTLVYTERGDISFSSAGDTVINTVNVNTLVSSRTLGFNLGTYDGAIYGYIGGDLTLNGGAIQSSLGDIDLVVKGDLVLTGKSGKYQGTIRSVGAATSSNLNDYDSYEEGGSIHIDIGGSLEGAPTYSNGWDALNGDSDVWGASFGSSTTRAAEGIVAMSGGDIYVKAGGSITAAIGDFGEGDVDVYSGGDLNGRFLVADGKGEFYATGNFGNIDIFSDGVYGGQIELLDAQVSLTVGGEIDMLTIENPTLANDDFYGQSSWNMTYTVDTSITVEAITGDVGLTSDSVFYAAQGEMQEMLPANVSISAGNDILLYSDIIMAPSEDGQLELSAGGDISGEYTDGDVVSKAHIYMSDLDPDDVYGDQTEALGNSKSAVASLIASFTNYDAHSGVLHDGDDNPVIIEAGGDIEDIMLFLPKAAEITARGDIRDIYYDGQNTGSNDISVIKAGGDIYFSTDLSTTGYQTGIIQGGPGTLIVIASGSIDLGTTDGIQMIGNQYNSYLSDDENDLILLAGIDLDVTADKLQTFFSDLKESGTEYSKLLAAGDDGADAVVDDAREKIIDALLGEAEKGTGNIDMVNSQIDVTGGSGSIYIIAMGDINVGKSSFSTSGDTASDSGIYTTAGGSIDIYSVGDLNVNESRVMTFEGGDIIVWTDDGDINAGRGSKASVNASQAYAVYDEDTNTWTIEWEAPAVGSGIRTLTFDPDGYAGPKEAPTAGDLYLFAPEGDIDASEAGISGTNVILGATEIVNAQNISFSQGSVGMPVSTASVNLGGISGMSNLTDTGSMIEEATAAISESREESLEKAMETLTDFITRYLNVEVLGFYEEEETE